ncbi:inosine-5-monophosphate dehydrogenase [Wenyingzhuangia fucanilytica]|uniref:Inosine-5-monophosphate dehydrogenase n=1 Tax=Wenyingzhuangia fucanilytica TaxID=1790137 RepID=A0A1B1Y985_9FLAO|nr:CBS domain-containing protein [Wenyingzhuangia fucanilytica]ANW97279.1 inosine-5-monophosphate dehydrogenase [Wenyingzhuangia fucanilytica]
MAIKNFKSPDTKTGILPDKILVSDYMVPRNRLITFTPKLSIGEAMQILVTNNIAGACVLDEDDAILGMISEGDCMKKIANSRYYNIPLHDQTVEEYMETIVESIKGDTNIFDAAHMFCTSRRNRFPVTEGNKIIGQISRKDVLKAALEMR